MVHEIESKDELKEKLSEAGSKLVIIDFFGTWCGPCKRIAPQVEELSLEMTNVVFLKIDVDKLEDVSEEYEITGMPTFVFIKEGKEIDRFSGANFDKLKSTVEKYM